MKVREMLKVIQPRRPVSIQDRAQRLATVDAQRRSVQALALLRAEVDAMLPRGERLP